MTATVISIILGVISIIGVIIKGFNWGVAKIRKDYKETLNDEETLEKLQTLIKTVESMKENQNNNNDGTLALLRFRLKEEIGKALTVEYTTLAEDEVISDMYKAYKALGGNHTIENMYKKYQKLPIKERK